MLRKASEILGEENLTDERRQEAASLREQARKIKGDADLLREIESEAQGMINTAAAAAEAETKAGAGMGGGFATFGEFLEAVVETKASGRLDSRLSHFVDTNDDVDQQKRGRKALAGTSGAAGGFLIPEQFIAQLQSVILQSSDVLARTTRMPMSSRTLTLPVVDYNQSLPAGVPPMFGGTQAFYDDEGAILEESEPKFREFTLTAHELTVYTEANNSLLADSAISLEAFLNSNMGMLGALMWKIEYSIFRGNGTGMPKGVLNSAAAITINRETDDSVEYIDLALMDEAAFPSARLAWYASISLKSKLRTLKDENGNYIWAEARDGLPATLLGYPVFFTDKLPRIGTTGDLVLADMGYYMFGDRQAATLDASAEANFRRNRTAYRLIHRHDGAPWMNAPLTLADTVTQVSPFILLGEYNPS